MKDYPIIHKKMVKEDGNYVNRTEFPQDHELAGTYLGVGFPKIHNLYKGAWNPKQKQMIWSFVMLVDIE